MDTDMDEPKVEEVKKTYVFDGVEVTLTGRIAINKKKMSSGKLITNELVEVTPVKKPGVPVWNKWIKHKDLFEIAPAKVESIDKSANK